MDLKKTLSEQIYEILRNDIVTQAIPCGSKLTLKILQERFHVSSTPIREALTRLAEGNLAGMDACALSSPDWQDYSDRFHLIFYDYCQNSRLVHSAERMRSQMSILAYQYEKQAPKQDLISKEHHMIFALYEAGQYGKAVAMMKEHLGHSLEFAMEICRNQPD